MFVVSCHPRGVYDNFENIIETYADATPFELSLASGLLDDTTLISYYSTACISGKLLFDCPCNILFLYPLAKDAFNEKCDYTGYFEKLQTLYPNIYIAHSQDELKSILSMLSK